MNISKDIKITLNEEELEAVEKVINGIVEKFVNGNLCDRMSCRSCPLAVFCPYADGTVTFEATLNDTANT